MADAEHKIIALILCDDIKTPGYPGPTLIGVRSAYAFKEFPTGPFKAFAFFDATYPQGSTAVRFELRSMETGQVAAEGEDTIEIGVLSETKCKGMPLVVNFAGPGIYRATMTVGPATMERYICVLSPSRPDLLAQKNT